MALNNYFYNLPLDLQEHILNINKKEILSNCFNTLFNNMWDNQRKDYKEQKFNSLDYKIEKIIILDNMKRFKKFKEGFKIIKEETKEKIKKILERKKQLKEYFLKNPNLNIDLYLETIEINGILTDIMKDPDAYYNEKQKRENRWYELENIKDKIELIEREAKNKKRDLYLDYKNNYYLKFDYDDEIYIIDDEFNNFKETMNRKYRH